MKFLLGTHAYNQHVQNIARALYERGNLAAFYAGGVDNYQSPLASRVRSSLARFLPDVDKQLKRRRVQGIPDVLIRGHRRWEFLRTAASRLRLDPVSADAFWERSELYLDQKCARALSSDEYDAFMGTEFGSLTSVRETRRLGKKSVVAFLSPHSSFRHDWVDEEYKKFPELVTPSSQRLMELAVARDARRNEEAQLADFVHTNSNLTCNSLVGYGIPRDKIIVAPLAGPPARGECVRHDFAAAPLKFIYAGGVSVHKGAHYLLQAWKEFSNVRSMELHFYGTPALPERLLRDCGSNVFFHGAVTKDELEAAYRESLLLIFPTLCDGFGMVVTEALANGTPVLTTRNAGAADRITQGKNGFIISARDAEAIAERIEWCVSNTAEVLSMRQAALDSAGQWTWADFRASFYSQLSRKLHASQA